MAKAPFKLRSGNAGAFKNLGSSPAKNERLIGDSSPSPRFTSPVDHPDGPDGNNSSTKGGRDEREPTKPKKNKTKGKPVTSYKTIQIDPTAKPPMGLDR